MPSQPFAISVVKTLVDAGHIAYFAGGWVRDYLMQHPSDDIDIATSASVEEIQALFPKTIPVGIAFGIVIVVEQGHHFEVATFRKESGYLDGRRPTSIESASAQEDAKRRDFTINGMFWDPLKKELFDFVDGKKDLERRIIRAIGDPHERFMEDRLRMIRAVRYSTRFDFEIELETRQAILSHAKSLLPAVAMERVWQEFKKMSQFARFGQGLATLHELQLLQTIFPSLRDVSTQEIQKRLSPISQFPKEAPAIAEIIELFPGAPLQELLGLCDYLKLSRDEKQIVEFLDRAKKILQMPLKWQEDLELVEWAHFYSALHASLALDIHCAHLPPEEQAPFLKVHEQRRARLAWAVERIQKRTSVVQAQDLIQEGIAPGIQMGALLKEAERLSVNRGIENKEEIISFLKKSDLWNT